MLDPRDPQLGPLGPEAGALGAQPNPGVTCEASSAREMRPPTQGRPSARSQQAQGSFNHEGGKRELVTRRGEPPCGPFTSRWGATGPPAEAKLSTCCLSPE